MGEGRDEDWDDGRHDDAEIEEWVFAAWTADGRLGVVSGHRFLRTRSWYWAALARAGRPLLHITDFEVPARADPFILKGEAMWAEHFRDAPMEQWSIGNETYASSLGDPDEALDRAYGDPTPIAFDLEWYATAPATVVVDLGGADDGYEQVGVVHGAIEILGEPTVELAEVPAHRWHRWTTASSRTAATAAASATPGTDVKSKVTVGHAAPGMDVVVLDEAVAHTGVRAPFSFPDGSVLDLVLSPGGWKRRRR